MEKTESPMMKQFRDLKSKHPEALLLFRCGDFYETYDEDAKACAKILGITLIWRTPTMRHKPGDYSDAMARFPHHALDTYLPKLIRAGKRVAICDQLEDPKLRKTVKRGTNNEQTTNNQNNQTTMAKTMKAADLIGKTIVVVNNEKIKYVVKSVDGDKLMTDFCMEGREPMPCPVPMSQVQTMVNAGTWRIEGASSNPSTEDVEEVQPAKEVKMEKPKQAKPKADKPKAKKQEPKATASKLTYETYTNKAGKVCARIVGIDENDAAYKEAAQLHAAASYTRDKKGNKIFYLCFGPRYADAAKQVCGAMNAGKPLADCKAIIDKTTEERAARREEWKQRRAEHNAQASGKVYTEQEVLQLIQRVAAGDAEAMRIVNEMQKKAAA